MSGTKLDIGRISTLLGLIVALPTSCSTPTMTPEEAAMDRDLEAVSDPEFVRHAGDAPAVAVFDGVIHNAPSIEAACEVVTRQSPPPLHAYVIEHGEVAGGVTIGFDLPDEFSAGLSASYMGADVLSTLADTVAVDPIHRVTTLKRGERIVEEPFDSEGRPSITVKFSPACDPSQAVEIHVVVVPNCGDGVLLSEQVASSFSFSRSESNMSMVAGKPIPKLILNVARASVAIPGLGSRAIVLARWIRPETRK